MSFKILLFYSVQIITNLTFLRPYQIPLWGIFFPILYDLIMILSGYKFSLLLNARGIRNWEELCYFLRGMKRYSKLSSGYVQQGIIFWGSKQPLFWVLIKSLQKKLEHFVFTFKTCVNIICLKNKTILTQKSSGS